MSWDVDTIGVILENGILLWTCRELHPKVDHYSKQHDKAHIKKNNTSVMGRNHEKMMLEYYFPMDFLHILKLCLCQFKAFTYLLSLPSQFRLQPWISSLQVPFTFLFETGCLSLCWNIVKCAKIAGQSMWNSVLSLPPILPSLGL